MSRKKISRQNFFYVPFVCVRNNGILTIESYENHSKKWFSIGLAMAIPGLICSLIGIEVALMMIPVVIFGIGIAIWQLFQPKVNKTVIDSNSKTIIEICSPWLFSRSEVIYSYPFSRFSTISFTHAPPGGKRPGSISLVLIGGAYDAIILSYATLYYRALHHIPEIISLAQEVSKIMLLPLTGISDEHIPNNSA
jgi:hypothetical protein